MNRETKLREEIVEAGRRLYAKGYIAGADGNISARLGEGLLLVTPTGVSKGFMSPGDMVVTDMSGRPVSGGGSPSSELKMHLLVYAARPEAAGIVHAHPPIVTGYASAGMVPDRPIVAEGIMTLGKIALAPYGTPGSTEVTDGMVPFVKDCDAILMANHGAVTVGGNVEQALFRMETLEHIAEIHLVTEVLGRKSEISADNLRKLAVLRSALIQKNNAVPAGVPAAQPDPRLVAMIAGAVEAVLAEKGK